MFGFVILFNGQYVVETIEAGYGQAWVADIENQCAQKPARWRGVHTRREQWLKEANITKAAAGWEDKNERPNAFAIGIKVKRGGSQLEEVVVVV